MDKRPHQRKPQAKGTESIPKKNAGTFTHFISVPLNGAEIKKKIQDLQADIMKDMTEQQRLVVSPNNPDIFHITLSMLTLPKQDLKEQASQAMQKLLPQLQALHKESVDVDLKNLGYFKKPHKKNPGTDEYDELSLIYVDIIPNELYERLEQTCHIIIKEFIAQEIIHEDDLKNMNICFKNSKFKPEKMHITLFRVREQSYKDDSGKYFPYNWRSIFEKYGATDFGQVHIPHIDISTRFEYDEEKFYKPLLRLKLSNESEAKKEQKEQNKGEEVKQDS